MFKKDKDPKRKKYRVSVSVKVEDIDLETSSVFIKVPTILTETFDVKVDNFSGIMAILERFNIFVSVTKDSLK